MRLLFTIPIAGLEWRVHLVPKDASELDGSDGVTVSDGLIYIRDNLDSNREEDTIVHELVHAFLYSTGFAHFYFPDDEGASEEKFVRILTPHLVQFLREFRKVRP